MAEPALPEPADLAAPKFTRRDAFLLGYLPAMALVAWSVPERSWDAFCRACVRWSRPLGSTARARDDHNIKQLLGSHPLAHRTHEILEGLAANHHQARLQILRAYGIGGWQPHLQLVGREHLEHALAAGRGGILWVLPTAFGDLVTKRALHDAGFRISHLSRPAHGFSPSRFGARVLNPIYTAVERRYLAERLVMSPGQSTGALRELVRRVRGNCLVSITVHSSGRRTESVPFFNGTLRLADGAPALAQRTGAALLPVYAARTAPGVFVTTVEPALSIPPGLADADGVHNLLVQCAALMESYVVRWPDQFRGWDLNAKDPARAMGATN